MTVEGFNRTGQFHVTPNEVVTLCAEISERESIDSIDLLRDSLHAGGTDPQLADRVAKLFQIACAQVFLEGVGVRPPVKYVCFDADGRILEGGPITDEPHFAAALVAIRQASSFGPFVRLACASAEVAAVNEALHAGSRPADLQLLPAAIFLEEPTDEGLAAARRIIAAMAPTTTPRPWWKLW